MFTQRLFNLVLYLIFSRWACGFKEHHGACEDAYAARFGLLHLEVNRCFVLDHDDAYVGVRVPTLHRSNGRWQWGRLHLGYRFCQGDEQIRQTGVDVYWFRPVVYGQACPPADDEYFPF